MSFSQDFEAFFMPIAPVPNVALNWKEEGRDDEEEGMDGLSQSGVPPSASHEDESAGEEHDDLTATEEDEPPLPPLEPPPTILAPYLGLFARLTWPKRNVDVELGFVEGSRAPSRTQHRSSVWSVDKYCIRRESQADGRPPIALPKEPPVALSFCISDRRAREGLLKSASERTGMDMGLSREIKEDESSRHSTPATALKNATDKPKFPADAYDFPGLSDAAVEDATHEAIFQCLSREVLECPSHPHHLQAVEVRNVLIENKWLLKCVRTTFELGMSVLAFVMRDDLQALVVQVPEVLRGPAAGAKPKPLDNDPASDGWTAQVPPRPPSTMSLDSTRSVAKKNDLRVSVNPLQALCDRDGLWYSISQADAPEPPLHIRVPEELHSAVAQPVRDSVIPLGDLLQDIKRSTGTHSEKMSDSSFRKLTELSEQYCSLRWSLMNHSFRDVVVSLVPKVAAMAAVSIVTKLRSTTIQSMIKERMKKAKQQAEDRLAAKKSLRKSASVVGLPPDTKAVLAGSGGFGSGTYLNDSTGEFEETMSNSDEDALTAAASGEEEAAEGEGPPMDAKIETLLLMAMEGMEEAEGEQVKHGRRRSSTTSSLARRRSSATGRRRSTSRRRSSASSGTAAGRGMFNVGSKALSNTEPTQMNGAATGMAALAAIVTVKQEQRFQQNLQLLYRDLICLYTGVDHKPTHIVQQVRRKRKRAVPVSKTSNHGPMEASQRLGGTMSTAARSGGVVSFSTIDASGGAGFSPPKAIQVKDGHTDESRPTSHAGMSSSGGSMFAKVPQTASSKISTALATMFERRTTGNRFDKPKAPPVFQWQDGGGRCAKPPEPSGNPTGHGRPQATAMESSTRSNVGVDFDHTIRDFGAKKVKPLSVTESIVGRKAAASVEKMKQVFHGTLHDCTRPWYDRPSIAALPQTESEQDGNTSAQPPSKPAPKTTDLHLPPPSTHGLIPKPPALRNMPVDANGGAPASGSLTARTPGSHASPRTAPTDVTTTEPTAMDRQRSSAQRQLVVSILNAANSKFGPRYTYVSSSTNTHTSNSIRSTQNLSHRRGVMMGDFDLTAVSPLVHLQYAQQAEKQNEHALPSARPGTGHQLPPVLSDIPLKQRVMKWAF